MAPEIVFIHGDLQNHTVFNNLKELFEKKGHRCFSFDLPGHGSEKIIKKLPEFLEEKITSKKPIIVAHSSGAMIASKYFERTKNSSGLILISPLLINPLHFIKQDPKTLKNFYKNLSRTKFLGQKLVNYLEIPEEKIKEIGLKTTSPEGFENNFNFYTNTELDFNFEIPVLFIAPEKDESVPLNLYKEMANKIKNLTFKIIKSGHNPLITNPKEIEEIIIKNYNLFTE
ncbi:alpha/beta hydrolase [archaeon]|nr:alpha/beta hydrolase [archaeon]